MPLPRPGVRGATSARIRQMGARRARAEDVAVYPQAYTAAP
jgi:hypothetical protein